MPGQPTIYTIALGGNLTLQTYVDPGKAGPNTVHYTFFNGANEQPISAGDRPGRIPVRGAGRHEADPIRQGPLRRERDPHGRPLDVLHRRDDDGWQDLSAYFSQTIAQ